jgi:hypothetical protein
VTQHGVDPAGVAATLRTRVPPRIRYLRKRPRDRFSFADPSGRRMTRSHPSLRSFRRGVEISL